MKMRFIMFVRRHDGIVATVITVLAIALALGSIFIVEKIWSTWDENLGILVALIVGLAPSGVLLYAQFQKEKRERHNWLLQKREACLVAFVEFCMFAVDGTKGNAGKFQKLENKLVAKMLEIKPQMILWGREELFRVWARIEKAREDYGKIPDDVSVRLFDALFRTIRKELDHDDSAMLPGEAVGVILQPGARERALEICKGMTYK